jgi:hypothetical protein
MIPNITIHSNQAVSYHPPLEKGETFLGNTEYKFLPDYLKHLTGIRFAQPAYDINGIPLDDHYAMIADGYSAGQYNRIMEARCSAIRRGTLKQ